VRSKLNRRISVAREALAMARCLCRAACEDKAIDRLTRPITACPLSGTSMRLTGLNDQKSRSHR
jgi:hypothetical protein